jgi:hypothetical protein
VPRFGLDEVEALADFLALEICRETHFRDHGFSLDSAESVESLDRIS